jgi:hypothetical protein
VKKKRVRVQTAKIRGMKLATRMKKKVATRMKKKVVTRVKKKVVTIVKKVCRVQRVRRRVKRLMNVERTVKKKAGKRRMMRGVIVGRKVDKAAVVNVHHLGRLPQDVDGLIDNPPRGNCCRGV